ncbi:MAG: GNAT family N-acetyltransferase [Maritimibacter sp.]
MISIRPATAADARQMAEIAGGSVSTRELADWIAAAGTIWHIAEDDGGRVLGFQSITAGEQASETCEIATFLRPNQPLAVGSRLFDQSADAARAQGYNWIDARFTKSNHDAQRYYQSHGFRNWSHNGDMQIMRFDLD